jgi:PhzF family phenazine biosynthesis protein
MKLVFYQVDAFAEQIFQGNPAAVFVLDKWLPDQIMQALAAEMHVSETAFVVKRNDDDYRIRWFTPTVEVALCGHATLAAAKILYDKYQHSPEPIRFHSKSGALVTMLDEFGICLDFPSSYCSPIPVSEEIESALGITPKEAYAGEDLLVMLDDASEVNIYEPNFKLLKTLPYRGVCLSAIDHGGKFDFCTRFFAPASGIDEDPVTGSAFTQLAPIYALKLGKSDFWARQISPRGGNVHVSLQGDRVFISGAAQIVMKGEVYLPDF